MWQEYFQVWGGVAVVAVTLLAPENTHPHPLGEVGRQQGDLLVPDLPLTVGHVQQALTPSEDRSSDLVDLRSSENL